MEQLTSTDAIASTDEIIDSRAVIELIDPKSVSCPGDAIDRANGVPQDTASYRATLLDRIATAAKFTPKN